MLRFIAVILCLFLVSLLTVPCSDDIAYTAVTIENIAHNHDSSSNAHDNCSPFCVCNCCKTYSVSVLEKTKLPEEPPVAHIEKLYFTLVEGYTQYAVLDIWQPPKLS